MASGELYKVNMEAGLGDVKTLIRLASDVVMLKSRYRQNVSEGPDLLHCPQLYFQEEKK